MPLEQLDALLLVATRVLGGVRLLLSLARLLLDLGALLLDLLELDSRRLAALQLLTLEVVPQRAPVARDDGQVRLVRLGARARARVRVRARARVKG